MKNSRNNLENILTNSFIILGTIGLSYLFSINAKNNYNEYTKLIKNYSSTKTISVERGDTYYDYAKKLMNEHPELKGLNINELTEEIQKLNNYKKLNYSGNAKIPVYNFSKKK